MTTFKQFNGQYIQGKVSVSRDGIVKMYRNQIALEKAIEKAKKEGHDCKAVKNGKSWAIMLN